MAQKLLATVSKDRKIIVCAQGVALTRSLPCTFPQQIRRSTLLYNDLPRGTALNSDSNPEDYIYYICMYNNNCSLVVIWLDCKGDTHDRGGGGHQLDTDNYVDWEGRCRYIAMAFTQLDTRVCYPLTELGGLLTHCTISCIKAHAGWLLLCATAFTWSGRPPTILFQQLGHCCDKSASQESEW